MLLNTPLHFITGLLALRRRAVRSGLQVNVSVTHAWSAHSQHRNTPSMPGTESALLPAVKSMRVACHECRRESSSRCPWALVLTKSTHLGRWAHVLRWMLLSITTSRLQW